MTTYSSPCCQGTIIVTGDENNTEYVCDVCGKEVKEACPKCAELNKKYPSNHQWTVFCPKHGDEAFGLASALDTSKEPKE